MQMDEPLSRLRAITLICKFMGISLCRQNPSGFPKIHWKLARGFQNSLLGKRYFLILLGQKIFRRLCKDKLEASCGVSDFPFWQTLFPNNLCILLGQKIFRGPWFVGGGIFMRYWMTGFGPRMNLTIISPVWIRMLYLHFEFWNRYCFRLIVW